MTKVTVFGAGKMGSAIGAVLEAGGAEVDHLTSSSTDAVVAGDLVVLAVPYGALGDIVARYADQFAGKVVVDVTNPINWQDFSFAVPADSSAAAELAAAIPKARVVKAFNTTFVQTLAEDGGGVVLVAGDDDGARSAVIDLVEAGGLRAVDAGALSAARELEAFAHLQIRLAMSGRIARLDVVPA